MEAGPPKVSNSGPICKAKEDQSMGRGGRVGRADLGIAGRAEPALILRQLLGVHSGLQALLVIASVACAVTKHYVVVLHTHNSNASQL